MFDETLLRRAADLVTLFRAKKLMLSSAESCTGGLVAALITSVAGSSEIFERGFVTYSNLSKTQSLGVDAALLDRFGAVSAEIAKAMAAGLLERSDADFGVSVTGIAGPGGGSAEKPVGLVHFACAGRAGTMVAVERRFGDLGREHVRLAAVVVALDLLFQAGEGP